MRYECGEIKVTEQITLAGADGLCDLVSLLGILPYLEHFGEQDLVAAIGVGIACAGAEDGGCIVLQHTAEVLCKDLHAVCVYELGARQ